MAHLLGQVKQLRIVPILNPRGLIHRQWKRLRRQWGRHGR